MKILRILGISLLLLFGTEVCVRAMPQDSNQADPNSFQSNQVDQMHDAFGAGINPMDLLHKMNLSPGRSSSDFESDSHDGITSAAEQFKKQQKQTIGSGDFDNSTFNNK